MKHLDYYQMLGNTTLEIQCFLSGITQLLDSLRISMTLKIDIFSDLEKGENSERKKEMTQSGRRAMVG